MTSENTATYMCMLHFLFLLFSYLYFKNYHFLNNEDIKKNCMSDQQTKIVPSFNNLFHFIFDKLFHK